MLRVHCRLVPHQIVDARGRVCAWNTVRVFRRVLWSQKVVSEVGGRCSGIFHRFIRDGGGQGGTGVHRLLGYYINPLARTRKSEQLTHHPPLKMCERVNVSHLKRFETVCHKNIPNTDGLVRYFWACHYPGYDLLQRRVDEQGRA
jgi:hypothetical protein